MTRRLLVLALTLAPIAASAQTTPMLTLAEGQKALAAAEKAATAMKVGMACAVIDARGGLVAAMRQDNVAALAPDAARGKALVSASFGAPSAAMAQMATSGLGAVLPGNPVWLQGALPIKKNGVTVGAIGCGGGTGQQDEDTAKAGLAAIQ